MTQYPEVIKNYERAILTPNVVEFSRLYEKVVSLKSKISEIYVQEKFKTRERNEI